jgi:hypothetical protein
VAGPYSGQAAAQAAGQSGGPAAGQSGGQAGGQPGGQAGGASTGQAGGGGPAGQQAANGGGAPGGNVAVGSASNPSKSQGGSSGGSRAGGAGSGRGRGSNWGLPGAQGRTTAITRPIHVVVLADRLILVPERGDSRAPRQQPVPRDLRAEDIDTFVAAVQREMKSWGLAVANGYWKPVLQIEVAPGAEHHFATLQAALEGSGFDVERKVL